MRVAVIDYGSGNLRSAQKALERAASERAIAAEIVITAEPEMLRTCDRIVLPGVGAFKDCRDGLYAVAGLHEALEEAVRLKEKPFLGICVGMQLMARTGLEFGETQGLGWIDGVVRRLEPVPSTMKVPHMGWNSIDPSRDHPAPGRHELWRNRRPCVFRALLRISSRRTRPIFSPPANTAAR